MHWVVQADAFQQKEFIEKGLDESVRVTWISAPVEFSEYPDADIYFDLGFDNSDQRKKLLEKLLPKPVIVNSVIYTLKKINYPFIRINAWHGFMGRELIEASGENSPAIEKMSGAWKKKIEWIPDVPGFITARVIAMIINEAYLALEEGVSSKDQIDLAMKTGTNYPFGPFEWGERIGLKNIYQLLVELSQSKKQYVPAPLLTREAGF